MSKPKPIDNSPSQTMDIPDTTAHEHKAKLTIDRLIHSKPKENETEKEFLRRKGVIKY